MIQPPEKTNSSLTTIPELTEVADAHETDIPMLTEIHIPAHKDSSNAEPKSLTGLPQNPSHAGNKPLSDAACQQLAAQIAPQIELLLQNAVRDLQSKLPELIRSALDSGHAANTATVDIIAPPAPADNTTPAKQ